GKGHLHDVLVRLACADQSVVRPHRNALPLPLLGDLGIGFLDQRTEPAEHLAPPVAELLDSRVDQLRRRLSLLRPARLHGNVTRSTLTPRPMRSRGMPLSPTMWSMPIAANTRLPLRCRSSMRAVKSPFLANASRSRSADSSGVSHSNHSR